MTTKERLIDQYVTEAATMLARLGDHLVTLDELRDSHKHASLKTFRLSETLPCTDTLRAVLLSHDERYNVRMASYLRYAHVVLTYIVLEDRLEAFGRLVAKLKRGPAFAPRGRGSLVQKFERYLISLNLQVPSNIGFNAVRLIRNCIVHARGCIRPCKNCLELRSLIDRLDGVSLDSKDCIALTTEACLQLQEGVSDYVRSIDAVAGFQMWIPGDVRANFEHYIAPHL